MNAKDIHTLFRNYESVCGQIAVLKYQLKTDDDVMPSQVMNDLVDLDLEKWQIRRQINSAFFEMEHQKPLWQRIFKK